MDGLNETKHEEYPGVFGFDNLLNDIRNTDLSNQGCDNVCPSIVQSKDKDTIDLMLNGGTKHDQDKLPFDLIPIEPLNQLARVLAFGARKYDRFNWTKGFKYSRVYAATLRHLFAWYEGEDIDPEGSGCSHLTHAMCNLVFLIEFLKTHPELDDRPFKETK